MKISHIAMYVNDLHAAKDFFMNFLGAKRAIGYINPKTGFQSFFLDFEDGARLELMNRPVMKDEKKDLLRTGYSHLAFSVGSREKVLEVTNNLRAAGYLILENPRDTGDGYYESSLVGFEGNLLEITV